jgi:hypothetical protein
MYFPTSRGSVNLTEDSTIFTVLSHSHMLLELLLKNSFVPTLTGYFDKVRVMACSRSQTKLLIWFFYGWIKDLMWGLAKLSWNDQFRFLDYTT